MAGFQVRSAADYLLLNGSNWKICFRMLKAISFGDICIAGLV